MNLVDGVIFENGKPLDFGSLEVAREIGRGANGIVFKAVDTFLQREVALKVWAKLRDKDTRDKVKQGMLEARKAYEAQGGHVIRIFNGGITQDFPFVVMEYFSGQTLKDHLSLVKPSLGVRLIFTNWILGVCDGLHKEGIYHGDLHSRNILIMNKGGMEPDLSLKYPEFRILDFGTSEFVGESFSMKRHIEVIINLADELAKPFSIREIYGYAYPSNGDWKEIANWIRKFNSLIPPALLDLGHEELEQWLYDSKEIKKIWHRVPSEFLKNVNKTLNGRILSERELGGDLAWNDGF
jgi:serine/threonine protein kinase